MKNRNCIVLILAIFALLAVTTQAQAATRFATVTCVAGDECVETITPNPIVINVGDAVAWVIDESCGAEHVPCEGVCVVEIPAQAGYPGWNGTGDLQSAAGPSGNFNTPGTYTYTIWCSPEMEGTIIVTDDIPTLSEWALIIFALVILGTMTYVIIRRRRISHVTT